MTLRELFYNLRKAKAFIAYETNSEDIRKYW